MRDESATGQTHSNVGSTLKRYLHIPFQTATGSWHFLCLPKTDAGDTKELAAEAGAAVRRLTRRSLYPASRSFDISRVVAGGLTAIPTGGLALGMGSAFILDGAWTAGLFNLLFFGAIATYGIWLVVGGLRSSRPAPATYDTPELTIPSDAYQVSTGGPVTLESECENQAETTEGWTDPRIRSFIQEAVQTSEPCVYDHRGTRLWGTTTGTGCQGLAFMLSLVATSLAVGLWIPAFVSVGLILVLLMLLAAGLTRYRQKPLRQFYLDLASDPPLWSSNDEQFWRPVKTFFGLQDGAKRRSWLERRRDARISKRSRKQAGNR